MSEAAKFSCGSCGKSYTWKPELAGKRVKCKCGAPVSVPKENPAAAVAEDPELDDLYALSEGKVEEEAVAPPPIPAGDGCPSCGTALEPGAVLCVACGYNFKTKKVLKTQRLAGGGGGGVALAGIATGVGGGAGVLGYAGPGKRHEEGDVTWGPKDLYIPIGLVLVGTVLTGLEIYMNRGVRSAGLIMLAVGVLTLINLILVVPAVLITVKLFDLGLGPIHTGLMKIAACAIFPGAVGGIVEGAIGPAGGNYIGWFVSYVLTLIMFCWLLEMDYFESSICATIIWLVRTWVGYALLFLLMGSLLGGGGPRLATGGGGGSKGGGYLSLSGAGGGGGPKGSYAEGADGVLDDDAMTGAELDEFSEEMMKDETVLEARSWLKGDSKRCFRKRKHDVSMKLVEELYAAGASEVKVISPEDVGEAQVADLLMVVLPKDRKGRKGVFDWEKKFAALQKTDPTKDVGQKYLPVSLYVLE